MLHSNLFIGHNIIEQSSNYVGCKNVLLYVEPSGHRLGIDI